MKRVFVYSIIGLLFLIVIVLSILFVSKVRETKIPTHNETEIMGYIKTLVNSNSIDSTIRHGVVFVRFLNANCSLCIRELEEVIAISDKYPNVRFVFFYPTDLPQFLKRKGSAQIIFYKTDVDMFKKLSDKRKPMLYVYKDLKFVLKIAGYNSANLLLPRFCEEKN